MSFPPQFLDEIRARLPVSTVVSRHVALKRQGREFVGLSPFKKEKTPSFTVNDEKGFYHCFASGEHGDIFAFLMKMEGLSFPEAVERLAQEAGLQMPVSSPKERERYQRQASLLEVTEAAAEWFTAQLKTGAGTGAREYLKTRGVSGETAAAFALGFAPRGRTALKEAMTARGVTEDQLVEAGLLIRPEDGGPAYDRFRNRLIFPIRDRRGRVVAFGGRALDDAPAKYLNSPETPLFHKGRLLFNLDRARKAAHDTGRIIVVEGYMDVIGLAEAGFAEAVAPLGTALTEDQIQELWRLSAEPVLCFDGDDAGRRAAHRAAERVLPLLKPGKSLMFAYLPEGEDPDSLVRGAGPAAMTAVLDKAQTLADVLWDMLRARHPADTPERRAGLERAVNAAIGTIGDRTVQRWYREHMNGRINSLWRGGRRGYGQRGGGQAPQMVKGLSDQEAHDRREAQILLAVVRCPWLIDRHGESFSELHFHAPELDRLRQAIIPICSGDTALDSTEVARHLLQQGFGRLLEDLVARAGGETALTWCTRQDVAMQDIEDCWTALMSRHLRLQGNEEVMNIVSKTDLSDAELEELTLRRRAELDAGNG